MLRFKLFGLIDDARLKHRLKNLRQEADSSGAKLVTAAQTKNMLAKAAAQKSAELLKKEADKRGNQLILEADNQAKKLVEEAKLKKEEMIKKI
mgnify:CR=1 FL=1